MASRENFEIYGWEYAENRGDGVRLIRYIDGETDIRLPNFICGKPVRALCAGAFPEGIDVQISLPYNMTELDAATVNGEHILSVSVNGDNPVFETDSQGALYNRVKKELVRVPRDIAGAYTVEAGTERVACRAFAGCSGLTEVMLPDSLTHIDPEAFYGCKKLKSIALPDGLQELSSGAFCGCKALKKIYIPGDVKRLYEDTLAECTGLTALTLGVGIERICRGALRGCKKLTRVDLPFTLIKADRGAAEGCPQETRDRIRQRVEGE